MAGLSKLTFSLDSIDPAYITAILAAEARSLSGPRLKEAQNKMAHVIINRMQAGQPVGDGKGTAQPVDPHKLGPADDPWLTSAYEATMEAITERRRGKDPTEGALEFNNRAVDPRMSKE